MSNNNNNKRPFQQPTPASLASSTTTATPPSRSYYRWGYALLMAWLLFVSLETVFITTWVPYQDILAVVHLPPQHSATTTTSIITLTISQQQQQQEPEQQSMLRQPQDNRMVPPLGPNIVEYTQQQQHQAWNNNGSSHSHMAATKTVHNATSTEALSVLKKMKTKTDTYPLFSSSETTTTKTLDKAPQKVLAGLVRSTREIQESTWDILAQLSCEFQVAIHITAASIVNNHPPNKANHNNRSSHSSLPAALERYRQRYHTTGTAHKNASCAPAYVELQHELLSEPLHTERIPRIAQIRDAQKERIQTLFFAHATNVTQKLEASTIIVADLDLVAFPEAAKIMATELKLKRPSQRDYVVVDGSTPPTPPQPPNVICGLGVAARKIQTKRALFFYDTFATVFWPNTFAHPLSRRLIPHYFAGEDPRRVRSNDQTGGNFTQRHIVQYLFRLANDTTTKTTTSMLLPPQLHLAPVRSCFGGMALYRASAFLAPQCHYQLTLYHNNDTKQRLMRYANNVEKQPCEHVVFHDCLHRRVFGGDDNKVHMAVDPRLLMLWQKGEKK